MSSTSPAVGRALDVLLYLAARPGPVQGSALIREIGMPRSSAYHLLDVLIERGFVVHLPDQRAYGLGLSAFEVGSAYLRHEPLEHIARPMLKRLVAAVGETAHLGILYGAESVYLLKEQPQTAGVPVTLVTDVGRAIARAPDGERPIDPRAPVRGSGAGAVPVVGRVHPPHRARAQFACGAAASPAGRTRAGVGGGGGHDHRGPAVGGGVRLRPCGASGRRVQRDPPRGPAEHRICPRWSTPFAGRRGS